MSARHAFGWVIAAGLVAAGCAPKVAASSEETAPPAAAETAVPARDFNTFVRELRDEAVAKGIRSEIAEAALANAQHIDRVIELDRKQPEFTFTLQQYLDRVVSADKVAKGRKKLEENRELLEKIAERYGVQPRFVVALWGIETDYGRVTGGYPVVSSLATLAFDGRRSAFFRGELMDALRILDQGHITPQAMIGSWAGAMGQCQFMPSAFLKFAADGDGDGRRDIWTDRADVLASAANYLSQSGWKADETWGRPVRLPTGFSSLLVGLDKRKSLTEWAKLGITGIDGHALPKRDIEASVIVPDNGEGRAFLVYDNFRTIMKWNRSTYFALAAGHLADRIGGK